jgi:hypothetical protein
MRAWFAAILRTTADQLAPSHPPHTVIHVANVDDALRRFQVGTQQLAMRYSRR